MSSSALHQYINHSNELMPLAAHAQRLQHLQAIYQQVVPSPLNLSSRVANLKLETLIVHADNAAVAAKLKQLEPRLRAEITRHGYPLLAVVFKVQPRRPEAPPPPGVPHEPLSDVTCSALADTAAHLPPDSPVRAALERMLRRRV